MPPTALTVQTVKGPFDAITADSADFTLAAADTSNGNTFQCTGKELIVAQNSGASPYTVTISSVVDEKNRTGDITAYSMAAGEFAVFGVGLTNERGWKQTDGKINLTANNVAVKFAILRIPG